MVGTADPVVSGVFSPLRRNAEVVIPRGGVEFKGRDDVVVRGEYQTLDQCPARDAVVSCGALQGEVGGGADPGIEAPLPVAVIAALAVSGLALCTRRSRMASATVGSPRV